MKIRVSKLLVGLVLLFSTIGSVDAGDFFERDGAALRGYDPVSYFLRAEPQKGLATYQTKYRGSTFYFVSESHRKMFIHDPQKYAPQFGGFCAFGAAHGFKVTTQPDAFAIVNGRLYLNHDRQVLSRWQENVQSNIEQAQKNWPEVAQADLRE